MVLKPTFEKEVHPEIEVSLLARSLSQDLPPIFENICGIKDAASVSGKARSLCDLVNEEHFEDLSLVESISSTRKSESNLSECSFNFDSDLCQSLSPVEEQPECGKVIFLNLFRDFSLGRSGGFEIERGGRLFSFQQSSPDDAQ